MARVIELMPGMMIEGSDGVFIAQSRHPLNDKFQLVIWYMPGWSSEGLVPWSFDMLMPGQDVGDIVHEAPMDRIDRVRKILQPGR